MQHINEPTDNATKHTHTQPNKNTEGTKKMIKKWCACSAQIHTTACELKAPIVLNSFCVQQCSHFKCTIALKLRCWISPQHIHCSYRQYMAIYGVLSTALSSFNPLSFHIWHSKSLHIVSIFIASNTYSAQYTRSSHFFSFSLFFHPIEDTKKKTHTHRIIPNNKKNDNNKNSNTNLKLNDEQKRQMDENAIYIFVY